MKAHLKKRGLGGRRAAAEVGLPEDAFRSLIKGHRPTIDRADEVCSALGITMTIGKTPTGDAGADVVEGEDH